jgi:hypothetical protein
MYVTCMYVRTHACMLTHIQRTPDSVCNTHAMPHIETKTADRICTHAFVRTQNKATSMQLTDASAQPNNFVTHTHTNSDKSHTFTPIHNRAKIMSNAFTHTNSEKGQIHAACGQLVGAPKQNRR